MRQLELPQQLHARFDTVCRAAHGPIAIAVSGGSDSIALLGLATDWAAQKDKQLVVLTVDHKLRPESAAEAEQVSALASTYGHAHQTLVWTNPVARQSAARRARHVLLATAVKEHGGNCILLGHTHDDQIETVLMRRRQGSTWYGLAGMQPTALSPVWPEGQGVFLGRPLLSCRRGELRAWLNRRGQTWIDDPSNEKPEYERVRVRRELLEDTRLYEENCAVQEEAASRRGIEDRAMGAFLSDHVRAYPNGEICVEFGALETERKARILSLLLQIVSGKELPPRWGKLLSLVAQLEAGPTFAGATLHNVIVRQSKGITVLKAETVTRQNEINSARLLGLVKHLTGNM